MMTFTHAVVSLAPDLDLVARHRRTLHYPVEFPVLAVASLAPFAVFGAAAGLGGGVLFAAATLHIVVDLVAGSAEAEPWDPVTEFGVYDHVLGRWHAPWRVVRYSGAPGDLLVCAGFGAVAALSPATGAAVDGAVVVVVAAAAGCTLARRRLSGLGSYPGGLLPPRTRRLLPVVEVEESDGAAPRSPSGSVDEVTATAGATGTTDAERRSRPPASP